MQQKRILLISILIVVLALPLAFSTVETMAFSSTQKETNESIVLVNQSIASDVNQHVFSYESFSEHDDIYNFENRVDADYARLGEE